MTTMNPSKKSPFHKPLRRRGRCQSIQVDSYFKNKQDQIFKVDQYLNSNQVKVTFIETGYSTFTQADRIRKGLVKDRLALRANGGFISDAVCQDEDGVLLSYTCWNNMLNRLSTRAKYNDVLITADFRNYSKFKVWFDENSKPYREKGWDNFELDKELLAQNEVLSYGAETCCLVPKCLNLMLSHITRTKKSSLPYGITFCKHTNKYRAEFRYYFVGYGETLGDALALLREKQAAVLLAYKDDYTGVMPESALIALGVLAEKLINSQDNSNQLILRG
jgi:hypothetical protein